MDIHHSWVYFPMLTNDICTFNAASSTSWLMLIHSVHVHFKMWKVNYSTTRLDRFLEPLVWALCYLVLRVQISSLLAMSFWVARLLTSDSNDEDVSKCSRDPSCAVVWVYDCNAVHILHVCVQSTILVVPTHCHGGLAGDGFGLNTQEI